ncbi:hypothetical protein NPIL_469921 [Nephila pilipes]|uniref:Uncharacterized protein n=1 Tax=Nephila pilipes TaxID=299642 RepID=A0A8X6TGI9_NEPPI|nr:hypothetical protein NPIL_469921 [Nephila pilipes]
MDTSYNVARDTKRWLKIIFFSALHISGINAKVIHIRNRNEKRRLLFRRTRRKLTDCHLIRRSLMPRLISERPREITFVNQQHQNNLTSIEGGKRSVANPVEPRKQRDRRNITASLVGSIYAPLECASLY